jgi:hypothetical protein
MNSLKKEFRPISGIAEEIRQDWKTIKWETAYLVPLFHVNKLTDTYIFPNAGKSLILSFLCNCSGWKGDTAKRIKNELKEMIK